MLLVYYISGERDGVMERVDGNERVRERGDRTLAPPHLSTRSTRLTVVLVSVAVSVPSYFGSKRHRWA